MDNGRAMGAEAAKAAKVKEPKEAEEPGFGELAPGDIPIFSQAFLDHNRGMPRAHSLWANRGRVPLGAEREAELRRVCGEVRALEEEEAALGTRASQLPLAIAACRDQVCPQWPHQCGLGVTFSTLADEGGGGVEAGLGESPCVRPEANYGRTGGSRSASW